MTSYTEGPWEVKPEEIGKDYIRIRGTQLGRLYKIADVLAPENEFSFDECRANARLVAAAPELFEALILAEAQIDSFYTATMTNAKSRDENKAIKKLALENVRSAISKATGGHHD